MRSVFGFVFVANRNWVPTHGVFRIPIEIGWKYSNEGMGGFE